MKFNAWNIPLYEKTFPLGTAKYTRVFLVIYLVLKESINFRLIVTVFYTMLHTFYLQVNEKECMKCLVFAKIAIVDESDLKYIMK